MAKSGITFGDRGIFASNIIRRITGGVGKIEKKTASLTSGAFDNESNFRYDPPGTGLKSTQQISLEWSKYENHTFFNSAEAKVNVAFDEIINYYPFDGNRQELTNFLDGLTGFEKYVLDIFPKHKGFLHFSGSAAGEDPKHGHAVQLGTHINVKDYAGNLFPDLSKDRSGKPILDPAGGSITFEFQLYVPKSSKSTHPQVILQKLYGNDQGITIGLSGSLPFTGTSSDSKSEDHAGVIMMVTSGSTHLSASLQMPRDKWSQVCATFNRRPGKNRLEMYLDSKLQSISPAYDMDSINFKTSPLIIGSGSAHLTGSAEGPYSSSVFVPVQTFSGSIDELRIFHDVRTPDQQSAYSKKNVFPGANSLKLYFKFNEPTGSYTSNNVVLDSSGNSLHSRITSFKTENRDPQGIENPMTLERIEDSPVLFPDNGAVVNLNMGMLADAEEFDANNPNLITKLVPAHYLLAASQQEGKSTEAGGVGDPYSASGGREIPGGGDVPSPQIVASLLYTWAKYFDEMKIFIDQLSNVLHVDYDDNDTVASQFLPFIANYYGFSLPNSFTNASIDQVINGDNLSVDPSLSPNGLQYIQNQIWRRILINLNEILRSKGTIHSIKSLMRTVGLNPDNNFRFREYGGQSSREIGTARKLKSEVSALLDFSGSLRQYNQTITSSLGTANNQPFLQSPFLSGSRLAPGIPLIQNGSSFTKDSAGVIDGTTNPEDGLFTSGSWTYEGLYKFEKGIPNVPVHFLTQSLARICTTGSQLGDNAYPNLLVNLIAFWSGSQNETGSLRLYARPGLGSGAEVAPTLVFSLNDVNVFDGSQWHISFGRDRNDQVDSVYSSSYFLRAGKQNFGEIIQYKSTSVFFSEEGDVARAASGPGGAWQNMTAMHNPSGSFLVIGSQSLGPSSEVSSVNVFLNSHNNVADSAARYTKFSGQVGQIRFWSKGLTVTEDMSHVQNFKSVGVQDPKKNFNFVTNASGSFERLRIDASIDQQVTKSNVHGQVTLFDFSQANVSGTRGEYWRPAGDMNKMYFHLTGSGFVPDAQIIKPEKFDYSIIDPKFDEGGTTNKIRIRSWQNYENVKLYGGEVAPLYEIPPSEKPTDDTRFGIEVSSVQALNEDIVNIFATLESFDNILGAPELLFSHDYPDLRVLRDIYFQRLTDKVNIKSFFEFFKWFDSSVGVIIESLVPRKTKFLGVNFVIESHMLERAKMNYNYGDVYLGENNRHGLKGTILLRQIVGEIKRF